MLLQLLGRELEPSLRRIASAPSGESFLVGAEPGFRDVQLTGDMDRANVGRVKHTFLSYIKCVCVCVLHSAVYYAYIFFVRRGDLYHFCCVPIYSAHITHITVEAKCYWCL